MRGVGVVHLAAALFISAMLLAGCGAPVTSPDRQVEPAAFEVKPTDAPDGYSFVRVKDDASGDALGLTSFVANRSDPPMTARWVAFVHDEKRTSLVAWTLTYATAQAPDDWRPTYDSGDWLRDLNRLCGLHARYGFVQGNTAVLVIGGGIGGDGEEGHVFAGTLDLHDRLMERAQGASICTEQELNAGRAEIPRPNAPDWAEPNDTPEEAAPGDLRDDFLDANRLTLPDGDVDWFRINATHAGPFRVELMGAAIAAEIRSADGVLLGEGVSSLQPPVRGASYYYGHICGQAPGGVLLVGIRHVPESPAVEEYSVGIMAGRATYGCDRADASA